MHKVSPSDAASFLKPNFGKDIRPIFPVFSKTIQKGSREYSLSYLDTAASSLKPSMVIDTLSHYFSYEHANIHRGAYSLSAHATEEYERARSKIACFLNAPSSKSIIFTRGTTESINLLSYSLDHLFSSKDTILLSLLEHHSNIIPWQLLAKRRGVNLQYADMLSDASFNMEDFITKLRTLKPKLVSVSVIANSFGTVLPISDIISESHKIEALVILDAAQAVAHERIDVQALGCDFLAFSSHKTYGPTGVGCLYVREELYDRMEPFQGGGGMIESVSVNGSTWAKPPHKFEAGTPSIGEAIAFGVAIDFLTTLGLKNISEYEQKLFEKGLELLKKEEGVTVYGPGAKNGKQASVIAFNLTGVHPHDLSTVADSFNVQLRAGHHCAMPALKKLGLEATARASLGVYSCLEDFENLIEAIRYARKMFQG